MNLEYIETKVEYSIDHEPEAITVRQKNGGHEVKFEMHNGAAIAKTVIPHDGENRVYLDAVREMMEHVEGFSWVKEARLDTLELE